MTDSAKRKDGSGELSAIHREKRGDLRTHQQHHAPFSRYIHSLLLLTFSIRVYAYTVTSASTSTTSSSIGRPVVSESCTEEQKY